MDNHDGIIVTMDKLCFSYGMTRAADLAFARLYPYHRGLLGQAFVWDNRVCGLAFVDFGFFVSLD